jgi:ABC-type nitrate/sulfonate/bicarbonate transport system ATPase subunit
MDKKIETSVVLQIDKLSVNYGIQQVLSDLHIVVKNNEIVSLIGKSGTGKSTLIKAINNNIKFLGDIKSTVEKRTVYQDDNLLDWFNGFKNISIALDYKHLPIAQIKRDVISICDKLGIKHLLKKYPFQMSGGEKKRIAIARAYIPKPKLILMDEPFSSLDIFTKEKMHMELLRIWNNSDSSIFFITHDIEEAIILSDRVVILNNMKISKEYNVTFKRPRISDIKYSDQFINLRKEIALIISNS